MDDRLYRPAAMVRMYIRLEDFDPPVTDKEIQSERASSIERLSLLRSIGDDRSKAHARAIVAGDVASLNATGSALRDTDRQIAQLKRREAMPRGIANQEPDPFSVEILTVPLECTAELNSYRSADTASFTFPFRDAPFESQNIRACLIEMFLGTVKHEDFATPGRWKLQADRSNLMFRGFVDNWKTKHSDDDAQVVVDARSLESVLIDSKIDPRAPAFVVQKDGEKISAYVNRVLASVAATAGGRSGGDQLSAVYYAADEEPTLGANELNRMLQSAKGRAQAAGGQTVLPDEAATGTDSGNVQGAAAPRMGPGIATDMSAWDLIVQACFYAGGCVPQYDPSAQRQDRFRELTGLDLGAQGGAVDAGDFILIRPAHTIFSKVVEGTEVVGGTLDGFDRRLPDPNSTGPSLLPSQIRFMVWGRNIKSIETNRKLGRIKVPGIAVYSYNQDAPPNQRMLKSFYPKDAERRATGIGPKGEGKREEIVKKIVYGVRSQKLLDQIATSLYSAVGRNDLSVTIETDDMSSYINPDPNDPTRHNENPDVLQLRHGMPVRVLVARQTVSGDGKQVTLSPLSEIFERRTDELRRFFLDQSQRFRPSLDEESRKKEVDEVMNRITRSIQNARRMDMFYVRGIKHSWSADDGWSATMDLITFVEARNLPDNLSADDRKIDNAARRKAVPRTTPRIIPVEGLRVEVPVPKRPSRAFTDKEGMVFP